MTNLVSITIKADKEYASAFAGALSGVEGLKVATRDLNQESGKSSGIWDKMGSSILGWVTRLQNPFKGMSKNVGDVNGTFGKMGAVLSTVVSSGLVPFLGTLGAVGPLTAAVIAAILSLVAILLGPVLAGLALTGVGFGALAMVAVPELSKIWQAAGQGKKAIDALPASQRAVAHEMASLQNAFSNMAKAVQPEIIKAFAVGLDILKRLMPALEPLMIAAGKAIDWLLTQIDNWIKGPSGKKFIQWMQTDGPKAIMEFGRVAWDVIKGIGRTFDFLYNEGRTAEARWKTNIHEMANAIDAFRETVIRIGHDIEAAWNAFVDFFIRLGHSMEAGWNDDVNLIVGIGRRLVGFITGIPGAVSRALSIVFDPLIHAGQAAYNFIVGIVNKIKGVLGGIGSAVNNALGGIPGKVLHFLGLEHGGITGAETGGNKSGWKMVGEHGRELVKLPAGSYVHSNPDTERMMSGQRADHLILEIIDDGSDTGKFLRELLRKHIRVRYGGNVNLALGS